VCQLGRIEPGAADRTREVAITGLRRPRVRLIACKSIDQSRGWRDRAAQPAALHAAADQPLANQIGVQAMRWATAATDTSGSRHAATTAVLNPAPCIRLLGDWDASERFGVHFVAGGHHRHWRVSAKQVGMAERSLRTCELRKPESVPQAFRGAPEGRRPPGCCDRRFPPSLGCGRPARYGVRFVALAKFLLGESSVASAGDGDLSASSLSNCKGRGRSFPAAEQSDHRSFPIAV
jgi:hypothetical protein